MATIQLKDLNSLAEKLSALNLTEGEATALDALLSQHAIDDDNDVAGFALQRMQQTLTGADLAGSLTGSGLYSMAGAGTELFSMAGAGSEVYVPPPTGTT